jgi:hypothetical protein
MVSHNSILIRLPIDLIRTHMDELLMWPVNLIPPQPKPLPPRPNPTQPPSPTKSPRTGDEASSPTPSFHGQISFETHHSPATDPTPLLATTEPSPTNPTLRRQTQRPYLLR